MLTKEQSEKILTWTGYQRFGWCNWDMWQKPGLPIPETGTLEELHEPPFVMPNFNDLNVLMEIVENKVDSFRVGFNKNPKKHRDIWYHVWVGIKSPKLHVESKSKSLVEALQQALLMLADTENKIVKHYEFSDKITKEKPKPSL